MLRRKIVNSTTNTLTVDELQQRYASGQRNFDKISLRGVSLKNADLRYISLKEADLSNSDLSDATLYGANLKKANINFIKLDRAKLDGAFFHGSNIACSSLIAASLRDVDLRKASLDAAILRGATLERADLSDAYLRGADLEDAILDGAYYSRQTHFASDDFDPISSNMCIDAKIGIEELLEKFNYLTNYGSRYFGPIITAKNWESSRPKSDWLNKLTVQTSGQIICADMSNKTINNSQRHLAQQWMIDFINFCSKVIRNFPYIIEPEKIIFKI
ncbi:putative low-complexity protein [Xenococcus sp. PCC 7305]|uniref:pentapeptide repeat-containing protein n=1 Tax=Xenococcus sp. PCC 7305 TaxID=102125 RepID=UPI0002AC850B|nr:pentapeptide repeat-containing protein [Xenococcus sp. PCC 7305]ELS00387.1 putative low-complexity protein [Xenococcus sp. PCC 7305]